MEKKKKKFIMPTIGHLPMEGETPLLTASFNEGTATIEQVTNQTFDWGSGSGAKGGGASTAKGGAPLEF